MKEQTIPFMFLPGFPVCEGYVAEVERSEMQPAVGYIAEVKRSDELSQDINKTNHKNPS